MFGKIGALAILATASFGGMTSTAAFAADPSKPVIVTAHKEGFATRRVSYADLNLAQRPDQKVLHRRVSYAVSDVCDEAVGPGGTFYENTMCQQYSWRDARPQIKKAIRRATEMAQYGHSDIQMAAIRISVGR